MSNNPYLLEVLFGAIPCSTMYAGNRVPSIIRRSMDQEYGLILAKTSSQHYLIHT
jgi:hypothetical protein